MAYRNYSVANGFIVDRTGNGDFTTISSAISAATSGRTIFIKDGTYNESPILKAGVDLVAFVADAFEPNVVINGNCTFNGSGAVSISGIKLQANGSAALSVSGNSASIVNLNECFINCFNVTAISFTSTNASSQINIINCQGDIATTGIAIFSSSSVGTISLDSCYFTNSGSSTTASTASAGTIILQNSHFFSPFSTTSTAGITLTYVFIDCSSLNATCLTPNGSGASSGSLMNLNSGTASVISIGGTFAIANCNFSTTNANAIAGAGTVSIQGCAYSNTGQNVGTTTLSNVGALKGFVNSAASGPTTGMLGEQIRATVASGSAISLSNNTAANVTSINLTAGVWDVSCVCVVTTTGTATVQECSISTTSATTGTSGDNTVFLNGSFVSASSNTLTIPSFRINLSTTTTVFLVAVALFSTGAGTSYGRISGTRVG